MAGALAGCCGGLLAPHFRRQKKYTPGQAYSPDTFFDPKGFLAVVEYYENIYLAQVAEEKSSVE